jgi:GNAT superfamily N-acetyltransferase
MDSECFLVELTAGDYEDVRALWEDSGLSVKSGGRDSYEQFSRQLAGGVQTVLGLRNGDRLIGVVVATHDARKGWINRLAVHPEYRRRGLGMRLVEVAEAHLRTQGMQVIAALIEDWNKPSLALFERAGYTSHSDIHYVTKRESHDV